MGNLKNKIDQQEQISNATFVAATIQPTIIEASYQVAAYGFLHKLEPKPDLTPFELWNIIRWTNIASNTWFGAGERVFEMVWDKAVELGIERHFDSQKM